MGSSFSDGAFTVVIPYYNEAAFLERTLRSWLAQTRRPERMILVDNASTDASTVLAKQILAEASGIEVQFLAESRPGKIHALETACAHLATEFTAFADADTVYPSHYLAQCAHLFQTSAPKVVAVMAKEIFGDPTSWRMQLRQIGFVALSKVFRRTCFTGGFGQTFRTNALLRVGGFSAKYWPYVLLDHEIMHRLFKVGRSRYHRDLWCQPSPRRGDRRRVRWNLAERLLYTFHPHVWGDWFFYRFLGPRLARRNLSQLNLRDQPWHAEPTETSLT